MRSASSSTGAGCSAPAGASFAEGAAFPMAFLTAWIPLTELVRIGFGARVLVTAAAGPSVPPRSSSCAR